MALANGKCIKKYQLLATGLQILETMIKDLPFNCKQFKHIIAFVNKIYLIIFKHKGLAMNDDIELITPNGMEWNMEFRAKPKHWDEHRSFSADNS